MADHRMDHVPNQEVRNLLTWQEKFFPDDLVVTYRALAVIQAAAWGKTFLTASSSTPPTPDVTR